MREDMAKVIVERPRAGGGVRSPKSERRRVQKIPLGELHKREGIKRPWDVAGGCSKHLNENLSPLRRFLRSRCGKPWDKVYGEICERINRNSAVQLHIWQHLVQFVCTSAIEMDGEICDSKGERPRAEFYVHPRTRLLRYNECHRDRHWRIFGTVQPSVPEPDPLTLGFLDGTRMCQKVDGVWYEFKIRPLPESGPAVYDYMDRRLVDPRPPRRPWEDVLPNVYAASKRQLNSKEIRRLLSQNS